MNPFAWLSAAWYVVYENWGWYKANPCDVGSSRHLAGIAWAITGLGSHCRCCSGARVLLAFVLGAVLPLKASLWIIAVFLFVMAMGIVADLLGYDLKDKQP